METKLRIEIGTNIPTYKDHFVYIYLLAQVQQLRLLYEQLQEIDWFNDNYKALKQKLNGLKAELLLVVINHIKKIINILENYKEINLTLYVSNIEYAWRSLEETLHEALFKPHIRPIEIKCEAVTVQLRLEQLSSYVDQMANKQINWN